MPDQTTLVQKRRARLQQGVHDMGALVIEALRLSVECMSARTLDLGLAERIVEGDRIINERQRLLEQECLVTLAAYKPAGADLRCVGACLALTAELERIGDYAADVARIVRRAGEPFPAEPVAAVAAVADNAIAMLRGALAAFDSGQDAERARAAAALEPQVDHQEHAVVERVLATMRQDPGFAALGTYLLWIVHNYARAADRATNVAERVVYIASGRIEALG